MSSCSSESRQPTLAVGVVVPQRAEAVLAGAALPGLQVHTVRVLHAAVALRAEVMACRGRREVEGRLGGGTSSQVTLIDDDKNNNNGVD